MNTIPYDFYVWGVISLICLVPTVLLLRQYKKSNSTLTRIMAWLFGGNVVTSALYSVPLLFKQDPEFIIAIYFLGDFLLLLTMSLHTYLIWYVFNLKRYLKFYIVLLAPFLVVLIYHLYILYSFYLEQVHTKFNIVDGFINFPDEPAITRPLEAFIALPYFVFGSYLIVSGFRAVGKVRLNYLCYGFLYAGMALAIWAYNLLGASTNQTAFLPVIAAVFITFIVVRIAIGRIHSKEDL